MDTYLRPKYLEPRNDSEGSLSVWDEAQASVLKLNDIGSGISTGL